MAQTLLPSSSAVRLTCNYHPTVELPYTFVLRYQLSPWPFHPYRFHQGCAIFRGPAMYARSHLKKTATVKPYRSSSAKKSVVKIAKTKVHKRICSRKNNKGKVAR